MNTFDAVTRNNIIVIDAFNSQGDPVTLRFERKHFKLGGVADFLKLAKQFGPYSVRIEHPSYRD